MRYVWSIVLVLGLSLPLPSQAFISKLRPDSDGHIPLAAVAVTGMMGQVALHELDALKGLTAGVAGARLLAVCVQNGAACTWTEGDNTDNSNVIGVMNGKAGEAAKFAYLLKTRDCLVMYQFNNDTFFSETELRACLEIP